MPNKQKKRTLKRRKGGGAFEILSGFERIRGQRYDKWLEQRLVLVHNDTEFVNKVRQRFGYDKTNIVGRGQLTKKMVEDELCERPEEQREMIDPSLKCDAKTGGKKRKTRSKRQRGGNQKEKDKYLFDAIDIFDYDKIENALNNGADVNAMNDDGDTPLMEAINYGDIDMVYLLLERPDINIELDVKRNKELRLAEELEPYEQLSGIPYAIEEYIETKNKIKKQKDDNIKELSNYKRPNISSLKTMAYYQSPSALDTHINLNPGTINRPHGKLGGKRKTRKRRKRIVRKKKHSIRKH